MHNNYNSNNINNIIITNNYIWNIYTSKYYIHNNISSTRPNCKAYFINNIYD